MMQTVIGPPGSGLTEACISHYCTLLNKGVLSGERILFLVRNQRQVRQVLQRLHQMEPTLVGSLHVKTFLGFVRQTLSEYWGEVCQPREDSFKTLSLSCFEPRLLTKDLTQHLLAKTCALCPRHTEIFASSGLRAFQIWDQISSIAYISGSAGISVKEVGERLHRAWPNPKDTDRCQQFEALSCCLGRLRQEVIALGAFDFGSLIQLFQERILPLPDFWVSWDHLLVDQAEDSCAVALEFYQKALTYGKSLFLTYTVGGGVSFTGVPNLIFSFISENHLSWTYPHQLAHLHSSLIPFGLNIVQTLDPDLPGRSVLPSYLSAERSPTDNLPIKALRGETPLEAIDQMVTQIQELLHQGVDPSHIAIIAPYLDSGLVLTLEQQLGQMVWAMRPFPALIQYPLIRALLTLLELAHPHWNQFPSLTEFQVFLALVLGLDPIRAELLAIDTLDPVHRTLRSSLAVRAPERVGFAALKTYQMLLDWLGVYQQGSPLPLDHCLRQFFIDKLSLQITTPHAQGLVRSLIETATRFQEAFPHLDPREFLVMIRSGQTASQSWQDPEYEHYLLLATPGDYIHLGCHADYHFWFDITRQEWTRSAWYPLYNSEVLTPEWDHTPFGELQDYEYRRRTLAKILLNLSCRIRKGLWLVSSTVTFWGEENTGNLDQTLQEIAKQVYTQKES
jgi:hypothetical protein